jgi:protein-disulfide isomerase
LRRGSFCLAVVFLAGLAWPPGPVSSQTVKVEEALAVLSAGPSLGRDSAPVTIVEFSDFQCSFCRKFSTDTLADLRASFIERGEVRFVYRHFAILGKLSVQAALASECAAEQHRFWPYHDKLFLNQGPVVFRESKLRQYAREVGLDGKRFDACLRGEKHKEKVEGETAVGALLGVRGTPSFFIDGRLLVGAQPLQVFVAAIEAALGSKKIRR